MRLDVLTLFPAMFAGPFAEGMVRKAIAQGSCRLEVHDLRQWAQGPHRVTDDYVFGGGPGMVLKPEPIAAAVDALRADGAGPLVLLTPQGRRLTQAMAWELSRADAWTLLCGRYEGVDERVREIYQPLEISIGDFVLTGGELPAMVLIDAVVRLLPGVLAEGAAVEDSFATGLLEGPHYTRPRLFRGLEVPEVLLSGDHARIALWRRHQALRRTRERRPELLEAAALDAADRVALRTMAEGDACAILPKIIDRGRG